MIKKLSIVLFALTMIIGNCVFAAGDNATVTPNAKASISGKVSDTKTGESLAGVAIQVEGTNTKAYTDLDGSFTVDGLTPGNYNLVLSLISYKSSLVENIKLNPNSKENINIKLDAVK
ncbi:MAG: carboxypeptidase-like regulatory domain-containing protein [Bacteroidota bacterium]